MKTIPASWQSGSTRTTWYNNRGTPLIFVRIQRVSGGYIRLCNRRNKYFIEEGGTFFYEYDHFKSLSTIEMALNFMQGYAGAVGQMGECTLTINNGENRDGDTFTDLYELDALMNAKVDIYYVPEESGTLSITNSLQVYKGIITNYSMTSGNIVLTMNDYSNIKHKRIPKRIDEFVEENSLGWDVPEESGAKVVPICFGSGYYRANHCRTQEGSPRYYYLCYHYPETRTSRNLRLFYWEESEKRYKFVPANQFTEVAFLSNTFYTTRFDITLLAIYEEITNYILPASVTVNKIGGQWTATNGDRVADKAKATTADASGNVKQLFTLNTYSLVYRLKFNKSQLDTRGNFDLYIVADWSYPSTSGVKRWEGKFTVTISGVTYTSEQVQGDFAWDTPTSHWYCAFIPEAWINEGYDPNKAVSEGLFVKNVDPNNLPDTFYVYVYEKPITNPVTSTTFYLYEATLRQVMLSLPKTFYVHDDFGNNIINDAISWIFTNFLDIDSSNIVYENFASEYKIDGQVNEEIDSYDLFCRLANEFGIIFYEDEEGKERFIDITNVNSVYEFTDNDVLMDTNGYLHMEVHRQIMDVYSSFFVDYCKNFASGDYEASKYVTKDNHNLHHIDSAAMQRYCYDAYQDYNSEKRMSVKLDFVRDGETAERILGKLVQFYSKRRLVIQLNTTLKMIDIEIGDQVTINTSLFSDTVNYYVVGKVPDYENKTITFTFLESPWTGSNLYKSRTEGSAIADSAIAYVGALAPEGVAIGDSAVAYLETV